jgi:transposase-like protein
MEVRCKYCASQHIVKYGTVGTIQRWRCRDCKKSFLGNENLPHLKTSTRQIVDALYLYCEGIPLNAIRKYMIVMHNQYPSISTIHNWMIKFGKLTAQSARIHKPNVGETWVADEARLMICHNNYWIWDLIDIKTHFLLASSLTITRTKNDAQSLMLLAQKWTSKPPELIFTDNLSIYPESIEFAWGSETRHIPSNKFAALPNRGIIDVLSDLRKGRQRIIRGTKKIEIIGLLLEGWIIHYNFFRPQELLGDRTPAEMAGIKSPIIKLQRDLLFDSIRSTIDLQ